MNKGILSLIKNTSYYLTNYFPIVFCLAVCMDFNATVGIIISSLFILLTPDIKQKGFMPVLISFLILGINREYALCGSIICGILLIISSFFIDKIKNLFTSPAVSGIMLSGALTATVLFTTDYFGIGATGIKVSEMVKSYISLGFHPNWRGVLFGTIVLVVMITFPRKFKNLNKFFSASFIALIITLILNIFLNPSDMISSVKELNIENTVFTNEAFYFGISFDFKAVLAGVSLYIIYLYSLILNESNQKNIITGSLINIISSGFFGLPLPFAANKNTKTIIPRILAVLLLITSFILFKDTIVRTPLPSCAVVIIVTAWNSVNWRQLKLSFKGIIPFICFIAVFAISLLTDISIGIIISFILSIIYSQFPQKIKK